MRTEEEKARLIAELRNRTGLTPQEVSDERLLELFEGSYCMIFAETNIAWQDLKAAIKKAIARKK